MNEAAVKQFIEETLASGRFRSLSQWADAAGLTVSTLHGVRKTGRADPETLVKIGAPANMSALDMFLLAGWLDTPPQMTKLGRDWLALLDSLPEPLRPVLYAAAKGLVDGLSAPEYQATLRALGRVAEPQSDYRTR